METKQIEINGLLWDAENLVVNNQTHFTQDEALQAAVCLARRLPTKEEYESILAPGLRWDNKKKGIWVAGDKLFFPASGYRNISDGKLYYSGTYGGGWTSTPYNSSNAWGLNFYSGGAYMDYNNRGYGFAVRCVQDAKK